ncbi:hypothetical protein EV127DRAFT_492151 [Xylaria flabelliformis]|nr:hypothetical protein EV127DRAFT_492151 [Xylaria flabelliformis]
MTPISALSLACNIIDLVCKAVKGVNIVVEVYKKGLSTANEVINHEVDSLKDIVAALQACQSQSHFNTADRKMRDISTNLISQCIDLQTVLDRCRSSQTQRLLSAFNASAKILRNRKKIEQLQSGIVSWRDELFRWAATNTHTRVHDILRQLETMTQTNFKIEAILENVDVQLQVLGGTDNLTENGVTAGMEEIKQVVIDRVILSLLDFPGLESRFDDVVTQEDGTFEWIFTDPEAVLNSDPLLRTTFPEWLEAGDEFFMFASYLINGKWSRDDELLIAKFFFWRVGAQEQKSMRGLIRGLLHQILCKVPKLSREIFLKETRNRLVNSFQRDSSAGLDSDEIIAAFSRLADISVSSSLRHLRICLFIDGLDEFDDIHINQSPRKLVGTLCRWAKSSHGHVKICVSSRIQEPFIDMLDASKRFTLHKLTKKDIELFIQQSLERHSKFQKQQQKSPIECQALIYNIRRFAVGVFLWVALVLRDLEAGLDDGIPIKRLQKIISEKPRDLDTLLEQIMNSIHETSRRGVEALLSAMLRATGTFLSSVPDTLYGEFDISILGAFFVLRAGDIGVSMQGDFAIDDFDFEQEEWFHDGMSDAANIEMIRSTIRTRCKGLIDIVDDRHDRMIVRFMHRSVPEFLHTYFCHVSPSHLDHSSTVVISWTVLVEAKWAAAQDLSLSSFLCGKSISKLGEGISSDERVTQWLFDFVRWLKQINLGDEWEDLFRILVSIEETLRLPADGNLFTMCALLGLHKCFNWVFQNTDILVDEISRIEVMINAIPYNFATGQNFQPYLAIMETAFAHGVDGRQVIPPGSSMGVAGRPLWHYVLLAIQLGIGDTRESLELEWDYDTKVKWAVVIELWLKHGADPKVRFRLSEDGRECIGVSSALESALDHLGFHPCIRSFLLPLSLQYKEKKELSLYDIVLQWKPPNEATLLDLLKSDIEDNSLGTQVPPQIEPDSLKIDNYHEENPSATRKYPGKSPSRDNCSVAHPNQLLRGWTMHILTRQYIRESRSFHYPLR